MLISKYHIKSVLSSRFPNRINHINRNLTTDIRSNKIFLRDDHGEFSFKQIDKLSKRLSHDILKSLDMPDLNGEKVGVYCNNNYTYLMSLLAIWHSNGVPICLSKLYPMNYLDYFMNDSKCKLIINGVAGNNGSILNKSLSKNVFNFILNEKTYFEGYYFSFIKIILRLF